MSKKSASKVREAVMWLTQFVRRSSLKILRIPPQLHELYHIRLRKRLPFPNKRLTQLGFIYHPFSHHMMRAENIPFEVQRSLFHPHGGFTFALKAKNTAVFASPGSGKTMTRLQIEDHLNKRREHFFQGIDVSSSADDIPPASLVIRCRVENLNIRASSEIDLLDYESLLLSGASKAIRDLILLHPDIFLDNGDLSNEDRDEWWALLTHYLGPVILRRRYYRDLTTDFREAYGSPLVDRYQALKKDQQRFRAVKQLTTPFYLLRENETLPDKLNHLMDMCRNLGLQCMSIMVDGFDDACEANIQCMEKMIEPMLQSIARTDSNIFWKLFLPIELKNFVSESRGISSFTLDTQDNPSWNEANLRQLIQLRLEWAHPSYTTIDELCTQDVLTKLGTESSNKNRAIETKLINMALAPRRMGVPRALLSMAGILVEDEDKELKDDESGFITWKDWLRLERSIQNDPRFAAITITPLQETTFSPPNGQSTSQEKSQMTKDTKQSSFESGIPSSTTSPPTQIKILFLAASPEDKVRLRLDKEHREIDEALREAAYRGQFKLEHHGAVRVHDLQRLLQRYAPDIVHFSGHGSSDNEIILENRQGNAHAVTPKALSELFRLLKNNIKCIVLNACYSEAQAQAISKHVDCVVGMSGEIDDESAIAFAASFYSSLGYGNSVKAAFELACNRVELENMKQEELPKLLSLQGNCDQLVLVKKPEEKK